MKFLNSSNNNSIYATANAAYTPASLNNSLIIKSSWGIAFVSIDNRAYITFDTLTGNAKFSGFINVGDSTTITPPPYGGTYNNPGYIRTDGFFNNFYAWTYNSGDYGTINEGTYYVISNQYGGGSGVQLKGGNTSWSAYSDRSLKKQIVSLNSSLPCILQLNPVTFLYNDDDDTREKRYGFIAQEIQQLFPHAVSYGAKDNKPVLLLSTTELIPPIVKAIQEQNNIILKHESTIVTLESKITTLETTVATLQAQLAQIIERLSV